ncbi:sulfite exporter TauE/SafE family protein [Minwuia sp.]|uniref:sulfite exporter TauE/SafE family protein n=1 Tax=Minwuia sp. TaxID=2493630 RepID=UPI003A8EBD0F
MTDILLLCIASFAAGALNAVAGGGTFLTFPALVYAGIPPIVANATATLTALPGYIGSAWAFRHDLRREGSLSIRAILLVSVTGGLLGSVLLLMTSDRAFSGLVPWLLFVATLLFAFGPSAIRMMQSKGIGVAGPFVSAAAIFAVSIYGGYFNGGLGIMLLATLGLLGYADLHGMNGLKSILSSILSLASAITFAVAGLIVWDVAIPMAIAAASGGYAGGYLSRRITKTGLLRAFVVLIGLTMTTLFFLR